MNKIGYPIYCINLKKQSLRKKVMEEQFKKYNMTYTICAAVDANALIFTKDDLSPFKEERIGFYNINQKEKINFHIKSNKYYQITKKNGSIGCTLSHLHYIHKAYINNLNMIIMCEDDISYEYIFKWKKSIPDIIKNAPNNWKIIKLHCSNINIMKKFIDKEKYINIPKNSVLYWSTGLYIINRLGMKIIVNKYYNSILNKYELFEKFPVIDYLLHRIDGVYYYSIPLVKNNNLEYNFNSDISYSNILTNEEKKGISYVENYYLS